MNLNSSVRVVCASALVLVVSATSALACHNGANAQTKKHHHKKSTATTSTNHPASPTYGIGPASPADTPLGLGLL